jgi:hypothetical protein
MEDIAKSMNADVTCSICIFDSIKHFKKAGTKITIWFTGEYF